MNREPALIVAAVAAVLQALVVLGVLSLDDTQMQAIIAAVNAVITLAAGFLIRSKVSPVPQEDS